MMSARVDTLTSIETLNQFLRGENSAVETYRQAIRKLDETDSPVIHETIARIQSDHLKAVEMISTRISHLGGTPDTTGAVWNPFTRAVNANARLFADTAAVAALMQGEQHGLDDVQTHLDELDDESRQMVADVLIPQLDRHVDELERLIEAE
ncbi:MAG: DUF2383 domain-containing protein [Planctomycetota bacterium]